MCPKKFRLKKIEFTHDSKLFVHFGISKTMKILEKYHGKNMVRDVELYVQGFLVPKNKENNSGKKLMDPATLEVTKRRWCYPKN